MTMNNNTENINQEPHHHHHHHHHNGNSIAHQGDTNNTTTSSGDDHLLTAAEADDENFQTEYKCYHDNRAFQYHNNNTLHRKGATDEPNGGLDVVIIQHKESGAPKLTAMAATASALGNEQAMMMMLKSTGKRLHHQDAHGRSHHHHRHHHSHHQHRRHRCGHQQNEPLKRNNATQTQEMVLDWQRTNVGGGAVCYPGHAATHCCSMHLPELGRTVEVCHCHITHHCHHYASTSRSRRKMPCPNTTTNSSSTNNYNNNKTNNKSSLESESYERPKYRRRRHHHPNPPRPGEGSPQLTQEIAIEIDAATTMTEGNTSTATSNFAYKIAGGDAVTPILMAPTHTDDPAWYSRHPGGLRAGRRRGSMHSNTTAETNELSADDEAEPNGVPEPRVFSDSEDPEEDREPDEEDRMTSRHQTSESITPRPLPPPTQTCHLHNESVKIRRKRYSVPEAGSHDSCSSCSCSRCSCMLGVEGGARSSSCSSIEDFEEQAGPVPAEGNRHEFTVAADCHRCQRQATLSTGDDEDAEGGAAICGRVDVDVLVKRPNTSKSPSVSSFCSCQTNSCCYCSCSCDECDITTTAQMRTARTELTIPLDPEAIDLHSSTLTPLTNPSSSVASTPLGGDDSDMTMKSGMALMDDASSSQSQSAEYFSLASYQPPSQGTPVRQYQQPKQEPAPLKIPVEVEVHAQAGRKPCKHYSKHHRHKRDPKPLDSSL